MSELAQSNRQVVQADKRSRRTLYGIILVFVFPIILAWTVLKMGWFESGVLSHGEWVEPAFQVQGYKQGKWALAQMGDNCVPNNCQQQLDWLYQAWQGLGAAKLQSSVVVLQSQSHIDAGGLGTLQWAGETQAIQSEQLKSLQVFEGQWLIIDPTGYVILTYPQMLSAEESGVALGMGRDLKKLIKNSRYQ